MVFRAGEIKRKWWLAPGFIVSSVMPGKGNNIVNVLTLHE